MNVRWTTKAEHSLRSLETAQARRIIDAVILFAETGRGDVKKLSGRDDVYRLRVGAHRVIFERDQKTMVVLDVGDRREVYR